MNIKLQKFISDADYSDKTKDMLSWLINKISEQGYDEAIILNGSVMELQNLLIAIKPTSIMALSAYCSLLIAYTKWINDNHLFITNTYEKLLNLDKNLLWKKIRPTVNKYLSYKQFKEIVDDIEKYEEYNSLYYQTLFRTIYEGVYNENLLAIANMCTTDLLKSSIIVHGVVDYELQVSEELIEDLKELANIDVWLKRNRFNSISKVKLTGNSNKSCFKVNLRNNGSKDYFETAKFFYYNRLRKIGVDYIGYNVQPLQIFISGIMYRVCEKIKQQGINLGEAFAEYNRNPDVYKIISDELARVHYNVRVSDFKFAVNSYLDTFIT